MSQRPILVFDVNETLLDLGSLAPFFTSIFDDPAAMREWFAQLVLYSQTLSLAGIESDFAQLAAGVLRMQGRIRGRDITDADVADLSAAIGSMPAHPDAAEALQHLQKAGFRMVTLTNSSKGDGPSALDRSGLATFFEASFSVQPSGRFKPAPQTYRLVCDALQVEPHELCLVACHVWDTIGLQAMGGKGALVTHGVNAPLHVPGVPVPDLVAPGLALLAQDIVGTWG